MPYTADWVATVSKQPRAKSTQRPCRDMSGTGHKLLTVYVAGQIDGPMHVAGQIDASVQITLLACSTNS
jgi:hypothetical protein